MFIPLGLFDLLIYLLFILFLVFLLFFENKIVSWYFRQLYILKESWLRSNTCRHMVLTFNLFKSISSRLQLVWKFMWSGVLDRSIKLGLKIQSLFIILELLFFLCLNSFYLLYACIYIWSGVSNSLKFLQKFTLWRLPSNWIRHIIYL
jgi:hypothetical protein